MATNGTPEQSNAAHQGGLPASGWFTKSGKLLIIGVVALLLVVAVGCNDSYGGDSGSSQSTASRSEWIDNCAQYYMRSIGRFAPHEREQRKAEIPEICECSHDYVTEYWGPDPPLFYGEGRANITDIPAGEQRYLAIEQTQDAWDQMSDEERAQINEANKRRREFMETFGHAASYCHRVNR